jgi:hypothetical protein
MSEMYTDGFFYHPDGAKPSAIAERIAAGRINPRLDDVFAIAVQETKDERRANVKRKNRLLARTDEINAELVRLDQAQQALDERLKRQHHAIEIYQQTGKIDDELLTPKCARLIDQERKAIAEAEFDSVDDTLPVPKGWDKCGQRVDDKFIYVTFKRQRAIKGKSPSDRVKAKIVKALDLLRDPNFDRQDRVQLWDLLGSLSPINPGAP